jgi:putative ABC transport system permease protein
MNHILYLAWRYLLHHPTKTLLLSIAVAVTLFLPAGLLVLANQSEAEFTARANATPLLLGARGSPLELTLGSLYFRNVNLPVVPYGELNQLEEAKLGLPIPLMLKYRSGDDPIVGTSLDYLRFRKLRIVEGNHFTRLGDCVVGAKVAKQRGLKTGDKALSRPVEAFDVAGVHPLNMRITGLLAPTGTADDEAIFCDVRTTWVIAGLGHGHKKNREPLPGQAGEYNEVTDDNLDSFHFHGDENSFPLSAIIVVPNDEKAATRLLGRYHTPTSTMQMIEPGTVMAELLANVVRIKKLALAALALVGLCAFLLVGLVLVLSYRQRSTERNFLMQLGASRRRVAFLILAEAGFVLVAGAALAALFTGLTWWFSTDVLRWWLA